MYLKSTDIFRLFSSRPSNFFSIFSPPTQFFVENSVCPPPHPLVIYSVFIFSSLPPPHPADTLLPRIYRRRGHQWRLAASSWPAPPTTTAEKNRYRFRRGAATRPTSTLARPSRTPTDGWKVSGPCILVKANIYIWKTKNYRYSKRQQGDYTNSEPSNEKTNKHTKLEPKLVNIMYG